MEDRIVEPGRPVPMRRLWWEGFRCGVLSLASAPTRARLRHGLRLCLCPCDLWRYHEFRAVLDAYSGEDTVLDIGSPKLAALLFARWSGATVLASDIAERVGPEVAVYARATRTGNLIPGVFDARSLPLPDNSVPFIYSISALEHIGGDGDSRAAREIGRILKPGGKAVITVPIAPEFREVWTDADQYGRQQTSADGKVFFSYIYDRPALMERLVEPSGLELAHVATWGETSPGWYEERYVPRTAVPTSPSSILTKLLDPYWAKKRIHPLSPEAAEIPGRGIAALTLVKED